MAKHQTRRSISVRGRTYEQLKAYAESVNMSISEIVEQRIQAFLNPQDAARNG